MSDFIPKGYLRLSQALVDFAEATEGDQWAKGPFSADEKAVWRDIRIGRLYAQALAPWLLKEATDEEREAFAFRHVAYRCADQVFRAELHAGTIIATVFVAGLSSEIDPRFWGTEDGDGVLGDGIIAVHGALHPGQLLSYGNPFGERLPVLVEEGQFKRLVEGLLTSGSGNAAAAAASEDESDKSSSDHPSIIRTGAAGRPSSAHFILNEMRRRLKAGPYPTGSQQTFGEEIIAWLKVEHPSAPPITIKSLRNGKEFPALFRQLRAAAPSVRDSPET